MENKGFEIVTDGKDFVNIVKALKNMLNEGTFKLDLNGISLCEMDPVNVSMISLKMLSSGFLEYKISAPVKISLNFTNLYDVLKTINTKK